jgi:DNA-directed RNA polymerase specialized sigma24 family protein
MYFPTTQWTLLAEATLVGERSGRDALDELCRRYWQPLARFIQLRGYSETEAQDLTQDFIVHLLGHSALSRVDRERGRFRTFLLGALVRFLGDERDRRLAQKRGGGVPHQSIDVPGADLASAESSEAMLFDREWALTILEAALAELRAECGRHGDASRFQVLQNFLPGSVNIMSYESAAEALASSVPALKSEVHRVRLRFRILVRQQILATVAAPHEVDAELEYLGRVLMDRGMELAKPSDDGS